MKTKIDSIILKTGSEVIFYTLTSSNGKTTLKVMDHNLQENDYKDFSEYIAINICKEYDIEQIIFVDCEYCNDEKIIYFDDIEKKCICTLSN